jgi:uncharacterized protein YkwD
MDQHMRWRVGLGFFVHESNRWAALPALATAAVFAITLALSAPPVGGLSIQAARADACAYAHSHPRNITRRQARNAIVCLINNRRAARGKGALASQSGLRKAAGRHSRRMKRSNCFAHRCSGEKDLAGRVSATSYLPCNCSWGVGENIAWGKRARGMPVSVVRGWMHSPSHRKIMLDGSYEHVGVGLTWGTPSSSRAKGGVFTADFGYKRG